MTTDSVHKIREFNRFYTGIIGVTNNHILESEYSLTEVRVMFEIYNSPDITARQLKEIIRVDEGYLSRLLNKMVKKKLVLKVKSTEDSRVYLLQLSKKGEQTFLPLDKRSNDVVSGLLKHLDTHQQKLLVSYLEKIQSLLIIKDTWHEPE